MSTDVDFQVAKILKELSGWRIGNPIKTPDDDGYDQIFGFEVSKGKKTKLVWVQADAECNGPGWLEVEEAGK